MKRGIIFSAVMVALMLVIFFVGLHLLLVDYRKGVRSLAVRKGEMIARELALNLEDSVRDKVKALELLSTTLFPYYLEGKITPEDLDRGVALQMRYGQGVVNVEFFNTRGVVERGYPKGRALLGLRLARDVKNRDFFLLFKECLREKKRKMKVIETLSLDPYSMELKHRPLLVVVYPVLGGAPGKIQGVLMASLDLYRLVRQVAKGPMLEEWNMAILGDRGVLLWSNGGEEVVSSLLGGGGGMIRVKVPFRVVNQKWDVVVGIPRTRVEAGVVTFYRKVEALILAFLFVLGLSLLSVYMEVRKSYRALASSEDRFRTLVEGMKEVFYIRKGGKVSYVSPGVRDKLGVSSDTLVGTVSSFSSQAVEGAVELEGRILEVKEREKGGLFYGLVRDITTERRLAQKVERERKFLDGILSSLSSGVMVLDRERRVLWMNTYLKEMFHLEGQVEGTPCHSLFVGREDPCPSCCLTAVLEGGQREKEEVRRYHVPLMGEERDLFMKAQRLFLEEGERLVVIYQDITETRRMEERVYFMDKLSSLGKLAASVAHELSTPLFVTSTNLDTVLKKEKLSPSARRLMEVSANELKRASLLLQRLRWVYRPVSMKREEVNIEGLLKDVVAILKTFARERKVGLNLEITPVPPFKGYKGPLMQVLLNLVTNAVEASPPDGEVTIRAEEEKGALILSVKDRGGGIPTEVMDHLFQPFVTAKGEKGAGLGLHLSYKLVESMGGVIEVESEKGKGTVFKVILPMEREEAHGR